MTIIAIEGLDGCGKTTQSQLLVQQLRREGYNVSYVRPLYIIYTKILTLFELNSNSNLLSPRNIRTRAYSSKRISSVVQIYKTIILTLFGYPYSMLNYFFMTYHSKRNCLLICDRYFYQFIFDVYGKSAQKVSRLFPKPDVAFYLKLNLDRLYLRMGNSFDKNVDKKYYMDVECYYENISQRNKFIPIDAKLSIGEINYIIRNHLTYILTKTKK